MCLFADEENTLAAKKEVKMCLNPVADLTKLALKRKDPVTRYKLMKVRDGVLLSLVYKNRWKPGVNKSNIRTKPTRKQILAKAAKKDAEINRGIHVFTTRHEANRHADEWGYDDCVVVKFTCDPKDLMGVGNKGWPPRKGTQEVYYKVTLDEKEYNKAIKSNVNSAPGTN
jgi:hypothetical protein